MATMVRDIHARLLAGDEEYQQLAAEHCRYKEHLEQIRKSPYRSAEDLLLEAKLKKLKLHVKDMMEQRIALLAKSDHAQ